MKRYEREGGERKREELRGIKDEKRATSNITPGLSEFIWFSIFPIFSYFFLFFLFFSILFHLAFLAFISINSV